MKKRITGLFLIVLLICQIIVPMAVFSAGRYTENDINLLVALNLLKGDENGDLRLEDTLKRSEYTALILRMMGHDEITGGYAGEGVFKDVSENHWAKGYIEFAKGINLIDGISEDTFAPDRTVSRQEAIKIIICALGYKELAEIKGGYPKGYNELATTFKILKNTSSGGEFTREDACHLILNSLTVDIMDAMGTVVSGHNVLSEYLDTEIFEGYVTGTPGISMGKAVEKGNIEIDGVVYKNDFNTISELFGYKVTFYLTGKDSDKRVVYIKASQNEERMEIDAKNIIGDTDLHTFLYYDKNERIQSLELADNIIIHYNGKEVSSVNVKDALLNPEEGSVTLFDREDDGIYDFAVVNSYRSLIVDNVTEGKIVDVYKKHVNLEEAKDVFILKENIEVTADSLKKGDVISVCESLDGEKIKIIADHTVINGQISAIEDIENDRVLTVKSEDKTFELILSESYKDAVKKGLAENWQEPDSRTLTFYIEAFGLVADIKLSDYENSADVLKYGYLIEAERNGAVGKSARLKVLTAENRFEIFEVEANKKVLLGQNTGFEYTEKHLYGDALCNALGGSGNVQRQIIRYRVDDKNVLKEIYLADTTVNPDVLSEDAPSSYWTYRQGVIGQKYFMDNSTIVFAIPKDAVYEDVMASGIHTKFFSDGTGYTCTLYDVDNGHVGAVVLHDKIMIKYDSIERGYETIINYGSSPVLYIDKVVGTVDGSGERFTAIEGWQNGEKIKINVSDALAHDTQAMLKLKPGAVIQYEKNTNEKSWAMTSENTEQLVVFEQIFDFRKDMGSAIYWDHDVLIKDLPGILTLWGTLDIAELGYCSVIVNENGTEKSYSIPITNKAVFMKYDDDARKFEPITRYELVEGQRVYMTKQSSNQVIVVY